jgi:hypothetical protein
MGDRHPERERCLSAHHITMVLPRVRSNLAIRNVGKKSLRLVLIRWWDGRRTATPVTGGCRPHSLRFLSTLGACGSRHLAPT